MTTPEAILATIHAYVRALNAGDLEAIVALYAEDASVEDPIGTPPHVGIGAIRAFYSRSVALPLEVALEGVPRIAGQECAFAFRVSFTYEGRRTTICPIDTFRFNDEGRIVAMRAYFGAGNITEA